VIYWLGIFGDRPDFSRRLRLLQRSSRVVEINRGARVLRNADTFQKASAKLWQADPFVFAPDSEMWRINRERCGLIFGPAAAILQVAHPRIAQGVYDHSDFRSDTVGRLRRTLESTNRIAFGRVSEAEAMRRRLAKVHGKVRGFVSPGVPGSSMYSAFELDLLVWVLATLITAAVKGYEFIYGQLPLARKEAFYRDMCRFGGYFGIDESAPPKGWRAFETYYDAMVESDLLASHWMCRELARAVIYPQDSASARLLGRAIDFLPLETLPPKVRERLGFRSTASTRLRMRLARTVLLRVFPVLPPFLRFYPEYLRAASKLKRRFPAQPASKPLFSRRID
jgi:uncharacterized protein (DUF2236 family)